MPFLDTSTWWHLYPLGALGAPIHDRPAGSDGHRLRRLDDWLDYAADLGCTGLLLGPIFASTSHGYDTVDHYRIDPRLGDDADFDHLVAQARTHGLDVLLDGVFNHVGRRHRLVTETLAAGTGPVRLYETGDGPAPRPARTPRVVAPRAAPGTHRPAPSQSVAGSRAHRRAGQGLHLDRLRDDRARPPAPGPPRTRPAPGRPARRRRGGRVRLAALSDRPHHPRTGWERPGSGGAGGIRRPAGPTRSAPVQCATAVTRTRPDRPAAPPRSS
ncbi:alpha-amylase family glycosyl hydrolase [Propionibacterium australiense]|uniref:Glycoside hydrolase superfamily n=1 Tax=Propionibacterium australiense TaxID=119981 RepID=A0A383S4T5_9ACTN|nr:alpha-amylase family glycosyl hydrolase [Propionibacterium australiense]RLP10080.1 hypothetical protein D9T14_05990 [Propionibacterium australiense]SYZ33005.1 Glycoside hydrolase superfamily [Propionibacterium australiense]VEH92259.1 Cyclomaltodextrinase [Propionibacterium australiense]